MVDDELVGLTEIAKAFGVARNTAWRWSRRTGRGAFPEPVARLAHGPVWNRGDVDEWAAKHLPRTGRPRKTDDD